MNVRGLSDERAREEHLHKVSNLCDRAHRRSARSFVVVEQWWNAVAGSGLRAEEGARAGVAEEALTLASCVSSAEVLGKLETEIKLNRAPFQTNKKQIQTRYKLVPSSGEPRSEVHLLRDHSERRSNLRSRNKLGTRFGVP